MRQQYLETFVISGTSLEEITKKANNLLREETGISEHMQVPKNMILNRSPVSVQYDQQHQLHLGITSITGTYTFLTTKTFADAPNQ